MDNFGILLLHLVFCDREKQNVVDQIGNKTPNLAESRKYYTKYG